MTDIVLIAGSLGFFAAMLAFVVACDWLIHHGSGGAER